MNEIIRELCSTHFVRDTILQEIIDELILIASELGISLYVDECEYAANTLIDECLSDLNINGMFTTSVCPDNIILTNDLDRLSVMLGIIVETIEASDVDALELQIKDLVYLYKLNILGLLTRNTTILLNWDWS